jgi:hypothetical protein
MTRDRLAVLNRDLVVVEQTDFCVSQSTLCENVYTTQFGMVPYHTIPPYHTIAVD